MPNQQANPRDIVFSPQEVMDLAFRTIEGQRTLELAGKGGGLKTGIADLDALTYPLRSSELITVMGNASNGKSLVMNYIAMNALKQIDADAGECVVKVTWEQSVEDETLSWISGTTGISIGAIAQGKLDDQQWGVVQRTYSKRVSSPLWVVGHSTTRSSVGHKARPRMTMTDILQACEYISHGATDQDHKIRLVVLDYLQRIMPDQRDGDSRREQMIGAVDKAKDLAICFGCAVLLGVQAGRQVLDRDFKLPMLGDGQETSNIEQSSDGVLSLWLPFKTEKQGNRVQGFDVTEHLMIMGLLKRKLGSAPHIIPLFVDLGTQKIASLSKANLP